MTRSEAINDLAAALSKAQGAMRPAVKDAKNPHFGSRYADLAANVEAARGPLADNGLSVVQEVVTTEAGVAVTTVLLHASGQWIQFEPLTVPPSKRDAHGIGSATTYARRYALGAALSLVADDDDGNAAVAAPLVKLRPEAVEQPPVPKEPAGFDAWWTDIVAVADDGMDALQAAWIKSPLELRRYVTQQQPDKWAAVKKQAAAKTAIA